MTHEEIVKVLQGKFPDIKFEPHNLNDEAVILPAEKIKDVAAHLKNTPELHFDFLIFVTAVDYIDEKRFELTYHLYSYTHKHKIFLKVNLPRENPEIRTVSDFWATADWHEREVYDLFGVKFLEHPDLRRIMMPYDWTGHPLRKDYRHPAYVPKPE